MGDIATQTGSRFLSRFLYLGRLQVRPVEVYTAGIPNGNIHWIYTVVIQKVYTADLQHISTIVEMSFDEVPGGTYLPHTELLFANGVLVSTM